MCVYIGPDGNITKISRRKASSSIMIPQVRGNIFVLENKKMKTNRQEERRFCLVGFEKLFGIISNGCGFNTHIHTQNKTKKFKIQTIFIFRGVSPPKK